MSRRILSAEQVRALEIGESVEIIGTDPEGSTRRVTCLVAFRGSPENKFLTYRMRGELRRCAIRDYPGKQYQK